jgi:hypothetical protein
LSFRPASRRRPRRCLERGGDLTGDGKLVGGEAVDEQLTDAVQVRDGGGVERLVACRFAQVIALSASGGSCQT